MVFDNDFSQHIPTETNEQPEINMSKNYMQLGKSRFANRYFRSSSGQDSSRMWNGFRLIQGRPLLSNIFCKDT